MSNTSLSRREKFACAAMQAVLSNPFITQIWHQKGLLDKGSDVLGNLVAEDAYRIADIMIKASRRISPREQVTNAE